MGVDKFLTYYSDKPGAFHTVDTFLKRHSGKSGASF